MPHGVRGSHLPNNPNRVTPEDLETYINTSYKRPYAPESIYGGPQNGFMLTPLTMGIFAFFLWRFFK